MGVQLRMAAIADLPVDPILTYHEDIVLVAGGTEDNMARTGGRR